MKYLYLLIVPIILLVGTEKEQEKKKEHTNSFYDKAFEYIVSHKPDSAFLYFNRAKDLFLQQKDNFGAGKCLVNMGIISTDKGDYFGGQELALSALPYFNKYKKDQHIYIESNLNNLGIASYGLKNYAQAIYFYKQCLNYTTEASSLLGINNNIANVYRKTHNYQKSIEIYNEIIRQPLSDEEYAKVLSNLMFTKWLQDPNFNAGPDLLKALQIRLQGNYKMGLNSSYEQLADYYANKQPDLALDYAGKMYQVAKELGIPNDQIEALQKLIKLSKPTAVKQYFNIYTNVSDSLQTVRNRAKNQFAFIRYDAEKNKIDNLKLQKENTEKKYQLAMRELMLLAGFIIFIALSIIAILWYRKRKQIMATEAQKVIAYSQLTTSKKVHDVVANGLYRVMTEIENQESLNKDHILDKIEDLYDKSRDISYEDPIISNTSFHKTITDLLTSFATEKTKILIAGNTPEIWLKVKSQTKYELEHIIQELMVNMKKHSFASNVVMRFERYGSQINIYYTDNGVGISNDVPFNNGLRNTGNRIDTIKGAITFETMAEKGLKIQISFPVS